MRCVVWLSCVRVVRAAVGRVESYNETKWNIPAKFGWTREGSWWNWMAESECTRFGREELVDSSSIPTKVEIPIFKCFSSALRPDVIFQRNLTTMRLQYVALHVKRVLAITWYVLKGERDDRGRCMRSIKMRSLLAARFSHCGRSIERLSERRRVAVLS